ncbi:hypothetical protein [Halobiforma nitratireducens]|uniref:Uncharacterized protein n=1 Tax=Halobiforma nitratireducens JCM 10879 TaxID=1227454 RepID=M0L198_9EURY|nr:hypothetical protein [Halobiforma nitratireducens]EMA27321.1 hypothetical protein C446_17971 [Halobiforma nitratireducens JCM 10879]
MSERVDPRDLPGGYSPAFIETRDGLVYVADATVRETGWLEFTEWSGTSGLLPPRECGKVKFVATERYEDQLKRRVADTDRLEQALPDTGLNR